VDYSEVKDAIDEIFPERITVSYNKHDTSGLLCTSINSDDRYNYVVNMGYNSNHSKRFCRHDGCKEGIAIIGRQYEY